MGIDELRRIKGKEEIKDCQVTMARYFVKRRSGAR